MILQFSVTNYKTFKDRATLNLVASNYDKETRNLENIHVDETFSIKLLKSAVVYGANASGKSKLIEAILFMSKFVRNSSIKSVENNRIPVMPFVLNDKSETEPTEFEIIFIEECVLYRYGFEVNSEQVVSEWLYYRKNRKEVELFYRDGESFKMHAREFQKAKSVVKEGLVRKNALLVSVAAQFNEKIAIEVMNWFKRLRVLSGLNEESYRGYTMGRTQDCDCKRKILSLLNAADLGIMDLTLQKLEVENLPANLPKEIREEVVRRISEKNEEFFSDVSTKHSKYSQDQQVVGEVHFSLEKDESAGTRKFFSLIGPVLDVLEHGYVLVIDELDAKLHPNLVSRIISMFNSAEQNPNNAQLIFNTHDTKLLSAGLFRRDQIWFVEKNKFGEARLYPLEDFVVRKTEPIEDNYIRGKYGAVPYLGQFEDSVRYALEKEPGYEGKEE